MVGGPGGEASGVGCGDERGEHEGDLDDPDHTELSAGERAKRRVAEFAEPAFDVGASRVVLDPVVGSPAVLLTQLALGFLGQLDGALGATRRRIRRVRRVQVELHVVGVGHGVRLEWAANEPGFCGAFVAFDAHATALLGGPALGAAHGVAAPFGDLVPELLEFGVSPPSVGTDSRSGRLIVTSVSGRVGVVGQFGVPVVELGSSIAKSPRQSGTLAPVTLAGTVNIAGR